MFAQTFIYALELAVCVLFAVLAVQVYRGYRRHALELEQEAAEKAAAAAALISARAKASVMSQRHPSLKPAEIPRPVVEIPVLQPLVREVRSERPRQTLSASDLRRLSAASNDQVKDPAKAVEAILNDYIGEFFNGSQSPAVAASKGSLSARSSRGEEDDQMITVSERSDKLEQSKIMSDKVVHAMLDEAKVVCIS